MWQKNKDTHAYIANIKQLSISGALMPHPSPETWVGGTSASVDHRTYIGQLSDNKCYRDLVPVRQMCSQMLSAEVRRSSSA